jgi:hypothetical protein
LFGCESLTSPFAVKNNINATQTSPQEFSPSHFHCYSSAPSTPSLSFVATVSGSQPSLSTLAVETYVGHFAVRLVHKVIFIVGIPNPSLLGTSTDTLLRRLLSSEAEAPVGNVFGWDALLWGPVGFIRIL